MGSRRDHPFVLGGLGSKPYGRRMLAEQKRKFLFVVHRRRCSRLLPGPPSAILSSPRHPITLRFIIPNEETSQNWRMNAPLAGAAEKEIIIPYCWGRDGAERESIVFQPVRRDFLSGYALECRSSWLFVTDRISLSNARGTRYPVPVWSVAPQRTIPLKTARDRESCPRK